MYFSWLRSPLLSLRITASSPGLAIVESDCGEDPDDEGSTGAEKGTEMVVG